MDQGGVVASKQQIDAVRFGFSDDGYSTELDLAKAHRDESCDAVGVSTGHWSHVLASSSARWPRACIFVQE
ncbi:hypothetical protein HPP92_004849 [Vanilla planifolia]|uniref:Uncharacterized protein n=1 Tax=Vanilla planifolia TaxID=51239 RepID=A0A835VEC1_VANPL|nr:hypothetical protein HPP92_004849 [Vanilla planifolia]